MVETSDTDHILWHRTGQPKPPTSVLTEQVFADVVVVGGGLTGCRTALGLAEAGVKVALLEGREIGWGASGRSGGQCNPIWRATPEDLAQRFGDAGGTRLVEATLTCADALFADIRKYDIECDHAQNGWVQAAHCKSARRNFEDLGAAWKKAGAEIEFLDREATQRISGSPEYGFSLFHRKGGHVHPLSLTRGFARAAAGLGATLYESSPVTQMRREGRKWVVQTPNGSVLAERVILTTNAYSNGLWPGLKETFYPMVSIVLATEPLSKELKASVLPNSVTISDSRRAIYYSRFDRDHRLIFGCIGSTDNVAALGGLGRLRSGLRRVFPQLKDVGIDTSWSGRIAVTPEMIPHLHEPDNGVLAALGFSGRGIAMTSVMARALVDKTLGAGDTSLPFPTTAVTPISFHWAARKVLPFGAPFLALRDRVDTLIDPV